MIPGKDLTKICNGSGRPETHSESQKLRLKTPFEYQKQYLLRPKTPSESQELRPTCKTPSNLNNSIY